MPKRVKVINETETGRNTTFQDNYTKQIMSNTEFVCRIKNNEYENYHIRNIGGIDTPVSNPDSTRNNNLG